jgi:hypothetical protein
MPKPGIEIANSEWTILKVASGEQRLGLQHRAHSRSNSESPPGEAG